jgi:hypothetical protein
MENNFMEQIANNRTRITATTSNILNLFFTNTSNTSLVNKYEVILGLSDQETVYIEANMRPLGRKKLPCMAYLHSKVDYT